MRTLPADLAAAVARRLVAASLADEPETGYQLARDARRLAARVGIVRETVGIAAYRAGHWAEALTELRAARRLTGRTSYLPMMADSERALGRLDRALALVTEPQAGQVDRATQIELLIVESGIRRDQGLPEAAAVTLQVPELTDRRLRPWSARLFYAYADALLDAGRTEEARDWFGRAAEADRDEQTDAAERYEDLDDVVIDDLEDDLGDENRDDDPSDDEDPDDEDPDGEDPDGEDPDGEDPDGEDPDGEDPDDDLAGDDLAGDDLAGDGDPEDAIPGLTPAGTDTTGHEVTAPDRVTQA